MGDILVLQDGVVVESVLVLLLAVLHLQVVARTTLRLQCASPIWIAPSDAGQIDLRFIQCPKFESAQLNQNRKGHDL